MFEYGLDKKQVSKQFRLAFAEANAMEAKEFTKHIEYNQFSNLVSPFIRIACRGRTWYEEHKAKKTGFHRMVRLTKSKPKPNPTTETEPEGEAPPPDMFISKFCKQVADEGHKCLDSKFFVKLATHVDSVDKGPIEQPENYSDVVRMLKRLVAASSEALENEIALINPDDLPEAATLMDWSRVLRASYATIHKYQKLGVLKGRRQFDRSIIVDRSEILRWLRIK